MALKKDVQHVLWVALILVGVAATALIVRAQFVPPTFGQYGTYRGASVREIMDTPVKYVGMEKCKSCHQEQWKEWRGSVHKSVSCETCHGPGMEHSKPDVDPRPKIFGTKDLMARSHDLCLSCHAKTPGRPADFAQVESAKHIARYNITEKDAGDKHAIATAGSEVAAQDAGGEKQALPEDYSCKLCHGEEGMLAEDPEMQHLIVTEEHMAGDVHWQKGLRCHDCHGGSPTVDEFVDHRDDESFRSLESPDKIREFCGHCHFDVEYMRRYRPWPGIDQLTEYLADGHGQRLKSDAAANLITCVSCHGRHVIRSIDELGSPFDCVACHEGHAPARGKNGLVSPLGSN